MRRERLRNRLLEAALLLLGIYAVIFYAFNPPQWLKLACGIVLIVSWVYLYLVAPARRRILRHRVK